MTEKGKVIDTSHRSLSNLIGRGGIRHISVRHFVCRAAAGYIRFVYRERELRPLAFVEVFNFLAGSRSISRASMKVRNSIPIARQ